MQEFKPQIIAFYCSNCATSAADIASKMKLYMPNNIKLINIPCSGRLEVLHLLKPFEQGADAVCIMGCQEDSCQFINGILKLKRRVVHVKKILEQIGIEPQRIEVFSLSAAKGQDFINVANGIINKVKELGPVF